MSVKINSLKFYDEFTGVGGGGTDFLVASIGDKMTAYVDFEVSWSTESVNMTFDTAADTITRNDNLSFLVDGFKVGDSIEVTATALNNGTYTILTVTDTVITIAAVAANETVTCNIFGKTPVTACDFYWNLIENDAAESYKSLTDAGNTQKYNATGLAAGGMPIATMIAIGNSKGWNQGSATVDDISFVSFKQKFRIIHTFFVTPLFLNTWLQNVQDGLPPAPDTFADRLCLKYIFKIDAKFENKNPDIPHTSSHTFPKGNTAWYDEFLNGEEPEFTLLSISETHSYCASNAFDIRLKSAHSFFDAGQKMVLNVIYLPLDAKDYIDTTTNYISNFRWDRVMLTEGAAPVNGERFGTNEECILAAEANMIGAGEMQVRFTLDLNSNYDDFIDAKDAENRNFLVFITPQDNGVLTTLTTNRSAVICLVDSFTCNKDDATIFTIVDGNVKVYHYPNEVGNEVDDINAVLNDPIYTRTQFLVKEKSGAIIKSLAVKIEAEKTGAQSVVLEHKAYDFTGTPPDCDDVQTIDIRENNDSNYGNDDWFTRMNIVRTPALDTATQVGYELQYGFMVRYEDWREVLEQSNCFPFGKEKWTLYDDTVDWAVNLNIYASVQNPDSDYITEFKHTVVFTDIRKFLEAGTKVTDCDIKTFDETETDDVEENILVDENTMIVATFTGDFAALPPDTTGYVGIIWLDNQVIGGISYNRHISSEVIEREDENPFLGVPLDDDPAQITIVNPTTIKLKARIDFTKLDLSKIDNYDIRAWLGYKNDLGFLLDEDGFPILQENGEGILLE